MSDHQDIQDIVAFMQHSQGVPGTTNDERAKYFAWLSDKTKAKRHQPVKNLAEEVSRDGFQWDKIEPKQCYANACKEANKDKRFNYCEGFVMMDIGLVIPHAWNVVGDNLFDFTVSKHWSAPPRAYVGRVVPTKMLYEYHYQVEDFMITPLNFYYFQCLQK